MKTITPRLAALFLFGAVVISFFDGFHTHSATTAYPHPWILQMAWWTPLLFGSTVAFGGLAYTMGYRALGGGPEVTSPARLAIALTGFGLLYFASGYVPLPHASMLALLVTGAIVLWAIADRSWQGIVLALASAACGCATEIFLTHIGAFMHLHPDALGIPLWLPGIYMASGPAIGQLARRVLSSPDPAPIPHPFPSSRLPVHSP